MRRLLREPLLHFLLIGLALFLWYGRAASGDGDPRRIVVTQLQVDDLVTQFQGAWNRSPTPQELTGLVESYIRDEMLYREGEALGLGRGDPVVKRRIRQKYEVMSEELLSREPPSEADLAAYLKAHPDNFRRPAVVTFQQILVAASGSATNVDQAIAAARRALERGADPATLGVATMLPAGDTDAPLDRVARDFGGEFAAALDKLPVGQWSGPVVSGFGVHLVRIDARSSGDNPPLDAVRSQVMREWENDRRQRSLEANLKKLRETYQVVIEAKLPEGVQP